MAHHLASASGQREVVVNHVFERLGGRLLLVGERRRNVNYRRRDAWFAGLSGFRRTQLGAQSVVDPRATIGPCVCRFLRSSPQGIRDWGLGPGARYIRRWSPVYANRTATMYRPDGGETICPVRFGRFRCTATLTSKSDFKHGVSY